jgi:hypothetical protein
MKGRLLFFLILTAFPCGQDATILPAKRAKTGMEWLGDVMDTAEFTWKGNELKIIPIPMNKLTIPVAPREQWSLFGNNDRFFSSVLLFSRS